MNSNNQNWKLQSADERYQIRKKNVDEKLKLIKEILKNVDKEQKKNKLSYGFAGTMCHIEETLDSIIEGFEGTDCMPKSEIIKEKLAA